MALKDNVNHKNFVIVYNYLKSWAIENNIKLSEINIFDKLKLKYPSAYNSALEFYTDEGQWSRSDIYVKCYLYARNLTNIPNFYLKCGRSAVKNNALSYWKYIAYFAGGPVTVYSLLPSAFADWNDTKVAELVLPPKYNIAEKKVKLVFKYTCHPHIVPEDEYCTDPHIRGLMQALPTIWPKSIFNPKKKLPFATVKQNMVQHDPIKLFKSIYFKEYNLNPVLENGDLFIDLENKKHVKIGKEVWLKKSAIPGKRYEYIGEYYNLGVESVNKKGILITKNININGETIAEKGTIFRSPHFILSIESEQPSITTRLINIRNIFKYDKLILNEVTKATVKMRDDLDEKQKAIDELEELKNSLEIVVKQKTEELERAHEKILKAEKREIEMHLTGGFAHEIRNAITGLQLEISSLLNYQGENQDVRNYILNKLNKIGEDTVHIEDIKIAVDDTQEVIDGTKKTVETVFSITDQIREYAKISKLIVPENTKKINVNDLIESILNRNIKCLERLRIEKKISLEGSPLLRANSTHLEIILNNLIINAIESIQSNSNQKDEFISINIKSNGSLIIEIEDSGSGLDQNEKDEIFKPFYTTKNRGSGLGLSFVCKLVDLYDGKISANNTEHGARFTVAFPGL